MVRVVVASSERTPSYQTRPQRLHAQLVLLLFERVDDIPELDRA